MNVVVSPVINDIVVSVGNVVGGSVHAKKSSIVELRASNSIKSDVIYTTADFGVPVNWVADLADTTSVDNTGGVIVAGDGTRLKAIFDGHVNVKQFGAVGDGLVDDTAAVQRALNFLRNNRNSPPDHFRQGVGTLYFPKGRYRITSTLDISQAYSLKMFGDGMRATTLEYVSDSGVMFNTTQYLYVSTEDLSFMHITETHRSTWTNILFDFHNIGGGRGFTARNCGFSKFGIQFKINDDAANGDHFYFEQCEFSAFRSFWWSSNTQAIIHKFTACLWGGNSDAVFDIQSGGWYDIDRGTLIGNAELFRLNSVGGDYGIRSVFNLNNFKAEWTQGDLTDAEFIAKPSLINCLGENVTARFNFNGCGLAGGYYNDGQDLNLKPAMVIRGNVGIEFSGGVIELGTILNYRSSRLIGSSLNILGKPSIRFTKSYALPPERVQILADAGNEFMPYAAVRYEDNLNTPDFVLQPNNFRGQTNIYSSQTMLCATEQDKTILRAVDLTRDYNVDFHGSKTLINKISVTLLNQPGVDSKTFSFYSDAAKTNLVAFLSAHDAGRYEVIIPDDLQVTEGIFVTCTQAAANVQTGYITIEHTQLGA